MSSDPGRRRFWELNLLTMGSSEVSELGMLTVHWLENRGTVPAVESWARTEPTAIRSDAWSVALDALAGLCLAVDSELFTSMFTGG